MRITREHYRDFIGALSKKIAELEGEILLFEHYDDGRVEAGEEWDMEDYCEYSMTCKYQNSLKVIRGFFENEERWSEFESLEALEEYSKAITEAADAMKAYTNVVLPVDGGKTVGVTQKEWDWIESTRSYIHQTDVSWCTFSYFCESGEIL